jgi:AraC-like DNA-binding protein
MFPQKPSRSLPERIRVEVRSLLAHERVVLSTAAPTVFITVESAVARAECRDATYTLERSVFLLVPRGERVRLRTPALASRVAILALRPGLVERVSAHYQALGVTPARMERVLRRLELLPRTTWVHELVHRYLFERCTMLENDNQATSFLEVELLKEVFFLVRDRDEGSDRASRIQARTPSVERALSYIEAHLFEPCDVRGLAAHAAASESTVLRAFHRELGCGPAFYWRSRKLDEALALLRSGSRSVREVSSHVGYENATAFGHAFRRRFGQPPSAFRPQRPIRPAP